ncbi:MAG: dTDP-glucose 4,6-dehydratase [Planctomycetota bacterium]|jgi:dTDP-glucose 4,6-dehydratase
MRVLITGGAGFIGSNFVRALAAGGSHDRGDEITVLDKLTYAGNLENLEGLDVEFVRGDVAEPDEVARLVAPGRFEAVVHFAAESHVDRSLEDPAPFLRTNVTGTQVMLDEARRARVGRFVHVSTDEVYGPMQPGGTATEDSPLHPTSPYSASKAAGDLLVLAARHTWGLPALIARPSNNYGPRQHPEKAIPLFLTNAMEGRKLPVYGDGLQERDWLFVDDCVGALVELLRADNLEHVIYNVSFGSPRPNLEMVRSILRFAGRDESFVEHVKDRPGHDRRYAPASSRLRAELGWKPGVDFEAGLARTAAWYRENQGWWDSIKSGAYREYYERMYGERGGA